MIISVIIATYNRSDNLRKTLHSLEKMLVPSELSWELIVVDNNSTDDTKELCSKFLQTYTLPLRYMFEGSQGKSIALNKGIQEATGEILAFTDDDAIVDPYWLTSIINEFRSDASISGIGGRVELYNKNDKPITIRNSKNKILLTSPQQLYNPIIIGVNMALKKRVFDEVGDIDSSLGPGTNIGSHEDADFIYRVYKKGFKLIYSPDVLVYHNHGRRTDAEVESLNQKYTLGRGAFYCKHILKGDINIFLMALWELYSIIIMFTKHILKRKSTKKNRRRLCNLITGFFYKATNFHSIKAK